MEEPKQAVTLSKLISREKFYKEKALKVERELIFSKEQILALEARIRDLKEALDQARSKTTEKQEDLQQKLIDANLNLQLKEERELELLSKIDQLENSSEPNLNIDYETKIEGYEQLLADIEKTLNLKEKELIILRKRVEVLENQKMKQLPNFQESINPFDTEIASSHISGINAISYSDHAVIFSKDSCIIRGDFVIENLGSENLQSPVICFRVDPIDSITLKGKVQSLTSSGLILEEGDGKWSIVQNEWSEKAKERGEIWIAPNQPLVVEPGERIRIPDIQFKIDTQFCNKARIEAFVFFENSDTKLKAINPILLNLTQ